MGYAHPVVVRLRPGILVTVDGSGTSFTRASQGSGSVPGVSACTLGQEADRLRKRRRRSPYTGVGVLRADRTYPKLKSTKKATKK